MGGRVFTLSFFLPQREGSSVHINPARASWFPGAGPHAKGIRVGNVEKGRGGWQETFPGAWGERAHTPTPNSLVQAICPLPRLSAELGLHITGGQEMDSTA